MSSSMWTPDALSANARPFAGPIWRVVEAQHRVSTMKLVDSLEEQSLLEEVIEETKPPIPAECRHLHYLLSTPFRYPSVYPHGSRFRRAGMSEGVFYASAAADAAIAEITFYRFLFYAESPGTPISSNPAEYTAFSVRLDTAAAIDLTRPPLDADRARWSHPHDYTACQALEQSARTAELDVIAYESVRDPLHRMAYAVLRCRAFAQAKPETIQSWHIVLGARSAWASCEGPRQGISFRLDDFAGDERIGPLLR